MKGVATWILVAGGIMIGMVVITLSFTIASNIFKSQQESSALSQFADLANRAEAICTASEGNIDFVRIGIPEITRAIYAAGAKFAQPPDKVGDLIDEEAEGTGNYLCLQFFDNPEPRCKMVSCQLKATYIGAPSLKEDLFSLVSKLSGSSPVYEYFVAVEKSGEEVMITAQRVISERPIICSIETVTGIEIAGVCTDSRGKERPVLAISGGKAAVYADLYPWTLDSPDFAGLLKSIGSAFGGRPLVIWEIDNPLDTTSRGTDPATKPNIVQVISDLGGSVSTDSFRRTGRITDSLLSGYGQVWLIRPGFCDVYPSNPTAGCSGISKLEDDETDALGRFVSAGGRILVITETPTTSGADRTGIEVGAVSRILEKAGAVFRMSAKPACDTSVYRQKGTTIDASGLSIPVKISAAFDCR